MNDKYMTEAQTTISLRSKNGNWLFEYTETDGYYKVSISVVDWVPPSPVVSLLGWGRRENADRDRRWNSVLPFAELPTDMQEALKECAYATLGAF